MGYGITECLIQYCNANPIYAGTELFGYFNATTGKYNGLVGALVDKKADVSGRSGINCTLKLLYY